MPPVEAVFFFSYFSTHLHLHLHIHLCPTTTYYCYTIPSYSSQSHSPPKTAFKKPTRNPHTTHVEISLTSDQNPNGRHTCDRHAANLLRFVHWSDRLQGWGGFHLDILPPTCTECGRYTILYYTLYLYLHATHLRVCLMYKV